jgi:hypothetical protein
MSWHYRIVRRRDGSYCLHELFCDDTGQPWTMTIDPITFSSAADVGPDGIIESLEMALKDARERPIFHEPASGEWPGKAPITADEAMMEIDVDEPPTKAGA